MTQTISRIEGLGCAEDGVRLGPRDGVLAADDGGPGHDVELPANGERIADLEASFAEGLADAGGCGKFVRANSIDLLGKWTHGR